MIRRTTKQGWESESQRFWGTSDDDDDDDGDDDDDDDHDDDDFHGLQLVL